MGGKPKQALPEMEYDDNHVFYDDCLDLWLDVIILAIYDAIYMGISEGMLQNRRSAINWLKNSDTMPMYCQLIGLDPHTVREVYRKAKKNPEIVREARRLWSQQRRGIA